MRRAYHLRRDLSPMSRNDPKRIYSEREECLGVFLERREEQCLVVIREKF